MKRIRMTLIALVTSLVAWQLLAPVVVAHPLGNFTINHYAGLYVWADRITVDYVLDMAEIPAFQEIQQFDANRNGQPDPSEVATYHGMQCERIRSQLDLRIDGRQVGLGLVSSAVEFPPGVGNLPTLRLTCTLVASIVSGPRGTRVEFRDNTYAERLGWREIVVVGEGTSVPNDIATASASRRLTVYPTDLLSNALDQRQIDFTFTPLASGAQQEASPVSSDVPVWQMSGRSRNDYFTSLITLKTLNLSTVLLALAISVLWGAMHAFTPGHGKTVVAAYLVGSRGTAMHALLLGLATTVTHTAGVFALGAVTLAASRFIVPEQLYPWLSILSGLLIVAIGLSLLVSRLSKAWTLAPASHGYEHNHPHTDDHGHNHQHHQDGHSHPPRGMDNSSVTWGSLLTLGISGGMLPCPSALVVLLSAIALNRIGFGLVLVLAFSIGLAGVLTGTGLLFVYAGKLFERVPVSKPGIRLLPAASALFVTLVGLGLTVQAIVQMAMIQR